MSDQLTDVPTMIEIHALHRELQRRAAEHVAAIADAGDIETTGRSLGNVRKTLRDLLLTRKAAGFQSRGFDSLLRDPAEKQ